MAHELAILSPEKALITYRLAGLGTRIMAHIVDLLIWGVFVGVMSFALTFAQVPFLIMPLIPMSLMLYFILAEGLWNGYTVGKRALGVRVCMDDGRPVTFMAAVSRNMIRPADMLPGTYLLGIAAMFTNPRGQRLGDLFARTIVVHTNRAVPRFTPAPHVLGLHPLEQHVGDLKNMTADEYTALRRLCDRFPELPTNVQNRLMRDVWRPIAIRRHVKSLPNIHDIYLAEAVVMKYGRDHGLL